MLRSASKFQHPRGLKKGWFGTVVFSLTALTALSSNAANPKIVEVKTGTTVDAYFSINIKGKVFVKIAAKAGEEACADFWWIKWPLGTIEHLGRYCNDAVFEIPSLFALTFSSKLRVGGTKNIVKIAVSTTEQVAYSHTLIFE